MLASGGSAGTAGGVTALVAGVVLKLFGGRVSSWVSAATGRRAD